MSCFICFPLDGEEGGSLHYSFFQNFKSSLQGLLPYAIIIPTPKGSPFNQNWCKLKGTEVIKLKNRTEMGQLPAEKEILWKGRKEVKTTFSRLTTWPSAINGHTTRPWLTYLIPPPHWGQGHMLDLKWVKWVAISWSKIGPTSHKYQHLS